MTESFSGAACPLGNECTLPNQECQNGACAASVGKLLHVTNRKRHFLLKYIKGERGDSLLTVICDSKCLPDMLDF